MTPLRWHVVRRLLALLPAHTLTRLADEAEQEKRKRREIPEPLGFQ